MIFSKSISYTESTIIQISIRAQYFMFYFRILVPSTAKMKQLSKNE